MLFVIIGVAIIAMNLADIGWFAAWNWEFTGDLWKFCVPFVLAAIWWVWADKTGMNKRREMRKMDEKRENRRRENLANMGMDFRAVDKNKRKANKFVSSRQREVDRIEGKREQLRQRNRESILGSRFDSEAAKDSQLAKDDAKR